MDNTTKRNLEARCKGCEYCRFIKAQDEWSFHGCFCEPYKGKWIAQIENCPKGETNYEQKIIDSLGVPKEILWNM